MHINTLDVVALLMEFLLQFKKVNDITPIFLY